MMMYQTCLTLGRPATEILVVFVEAVAEGVREATPRKVAVISATEQIIREDLPFVRGIERMDFINVVMR